MKALAEQFVWSFCYIAAIPALFIVLVRFEGIMYTLTHLGG